MMTQRNSSFELLRILAMAVIVIGHFCSQSAIAGSSVQANRILALLLGGGNRIAVNLFLVLGTWFMVDSRFRPERILRIYLQLVLCVIPLTLVMLLAGQADGARNVIQGLLPFLGRPLWFVTAYISLIALSPFLNYAFRLDDRALLRLVLVTGFVFCVVATVPSYTAPEYLADFAWFAVVYVFIGWAKRTDALDRLPGRWVSLVLGLGLCAALSLASLQPNLAWVASYWNIHLQSIPNILSAVLIFNFFRLSDFGVRRGINWMASAAFSVYIVHQTPAFRAYEWGVLFHAERLSALPPAAFAAGLIAVPLTLFLVLAVVDRLYVRPLGRLIERTAAFGSIVRALDGLYPSARDYTP